MMLSLVVDVLRYMTVLPLLEFVRVVTPPVLAVKVVVPAVMRSEFVMVAEVSSRVAQPVPLQVWKMPPVYLIPPVRLLSQASPPLDRRTVPLTSSEVWGVVVLRPISPVTRMVARLMPFVPKVRLELSTFIMRAPLAVALTSKRPEVSPMFTGPRTSSV
jgi:hypothetical protein